MGEDTQWIAKVFQVSELKYQLLVQASGCHGSSRKYLHQRQQGVRRRAVPAGEIGNIFKGTGTEHDIGLKTGVKERLDQNISSEVECRECKEYLRQNALDGCRSGRSQYLLNCEQCEC